MADLHASVRNRIPAYRHGLLDAGGAQEVRAHLRDCVDCRAEFEPFLDRTEDEEMRAGHVPIALISRWDVFAPRLAEAERALLEGHFETCERCRTSREFGRALRAGERSDQPRPRKGWMGFGAAVIAAITAAVAVVVLRDQPAAHNVPAPPVEQPARKTSPTPVRARTVALASPMRGGEEAVVRVPRGATVLPLRVPPLLGVGPDALIRIRAFGPGGIPFGHAQLAHRALFGDSADPALDAQAPHGPLPPGHYRVVVVSDVPDPQVPGSYEGAEYDFDLGLQ
jgi:hypothetical protein